MSTTREIIRKRTSDKYRRIVSHLVYWPKRIQFRQNSHLGRKRKINGRELIVNPGVFDPVLFRTGKFFADFLNTNISEVRPANSVRSLDLCTGTGVLAVELAAKGYSVDAVDLNQDAAACATRNAEHIQLKGSIRVFEGDLFTPVKAKRYALITAHFPSYKAPPRPGFDQSWRSEDIFERFAKELPDHLEDSGIAYTLVSSHGDFEILLDCLDAADFIYRNVASKSFFGERMCICAIRL